MKGVVDVAAAETIRCFAYAVLKEETKEGSQDFEGTTVVVELAFRSSY